MSSLRYQLWRIKSWLKDRLLPCPGFIHYEGGKGLAGGFYIVPACGDHIGAPHQCKALYLRCSMSQERCNSCPGFEAYRQALTAQKVGGELDVAIGAMQEKPVVRQRDRESAEGLVENYKKYGIAAISLVESGHQVDDAQPIQQLRAHPELQDYAVIFVEHHQLPADIDAQPGDMIIRIEHAA